MPLKFVLLVGLVSVLFFTGCGQDNSRLREKAEIEGEAAAKKNIEQENEIAKTMEEDLARQQNFLKALRGSFEGTFQDDDSSADSPIQEQASNKRTRIKKVQIDLDSVFKTYRPDRVRRIGEIQEDLAKLRLTAFIRQELLGNDLSKDACQVERTEPDPKLGLVKIQTNECPAFFTLYLSEQNSDESTENSEGFFQKVASSQEVARKVMAAEIQQIDVLYVDAKYANGPKKFVLKRVER